MALQQELEREGNWLFRYRSYLPIAMLCAGMLVFYAALHEREGLFFKLGEHWQAYEFACLAVSLLGVIVRIYTVGHTPANTSGKNTSGQLADELNTTGIYSAVRHPLYLGNFLMYLGISLLVCDWGFACIFVLAYWLYYERIMYCEEQFLQRKFGETYSEWASQTPAFIPNFTRFRKPVYSFSWKKVLKKEKNGVFALFLIFALFDGVAAFGFSSNGFAMPKECAASLNPVFLSLAVFSGAGYLVLKVIKKKTSLLDEKGR